jgi:Spy/CpxP family protein refolding chaperone
MERSLPPGPWWRNPDMAQKLGLNSDQQKKIEDVFQQHRLKLVDLDATLRKEEITLEPLMAADSPDETKTLAQIDKVAQARAELEKANARFLFAIRRVLTPDQWKKLQEVSRPEGGDRGGPPAPPQPGLGGRGR